MNDQRFAHLVFFTLKDSSQEACGSLVSAIKKYLSEHPGTVHFSAGLMEDTKRDVVDTDYHVSLQLIFKDRASQDAYQVAEDHDKFIAEQKHNWTKVRVFDSVICS